MKARLQQATNREKHQNRKIHRLLSKRLTWMMFLRMRALRAMQLSFVSARAKWGMELTPLSILHIPSTTSHTAAKITQRNTKLHLYERYLIEIFFGNVREYKWWMNCSYVQMYVIFVMINNNLLNNKVKAVIFHFRNESNKK